MKNQKVLPVLIAIIFLVVSSFTSSSKKIFSGHGYGIEQRVDLGFGNSRWYVRDVDSVSDWGCEVGEVGCLIDISQANEWRLNYISSGYYYIDGPTNNPPFVIVSSGTFVFI